MLTAPSRRSGASFSFLGRGQRRGGDIFGETAQRGQRPSKTGHFRWLLSTIFAAAVGATAIVVLVLGSMEPGTGSSIVFKDWVPSRDASAPSFRRQAQADAGLRWAVPKSDKLQSLSGTLSARFIIQDSARVRRDKREMIVNKSYVRLVARLAPVASNTTEQIPAFNPYKLYGSPAQEDANQADADVDDVATRVIDLIGGLLPVEDGQELDAQEVADLVTRSMATLEEPASTVAAMRGGFQLDGSDRTAGRQLLAERSAARALPEILPPNTSAFAKTVVETEDLADDLEAREVRVTKVGRGQTLTRILRDMGGEPAQVKLMVEAARATVADNDLVPGQEVHVTLVPSLTRKNKLEPVRFSLFTEGQEHKVTVARNNAGEFVASQSPIDERIARAALNPDDQMQNSSLYTSYYHAALMHGLGHETVNTLLRIHAYETDFRRRVRGGDQVEWFFDVKDDERATDQALGDLLVTSITLGGETQKFYRFRTPDGIVDYYDESGDTSRKFLMRRPVRGDAVRLASGFGSRRHPILGYFRPHNGVDWAGPIGTAIMAAGSGTIEEAGRKGEFGNYVRIRHANGYTTAYAHMSRFGAGISEGVRVRQGQVIGYIGNTGLSAGPHLHYEVLINRQPVDPMTIQVPRERRLTGQHLREFQKERARIDELMRRNPVSARIMDQVAQR